MFTESFHSECSLQPLKTISTPQLMYLVSVYPVNNINIEMLNSDLRRIADKVPSQYLISLGVFIIFLHNMHECFIARYMGQIKYDYTNISGKTTLTRRWVRVKGVRPGN